MNLAKSLKIAGFSLTEIVITIIIIGVLAGIALPRLIAQREAGVFMEAIHGGRALYAAEKSWWLEHNRSFAGILANCSNLEYQANLSANFAAPVCNQAGVTGRIGISRAGALYTLIVSETDGSMTCPACPRNLQKLLP